MMKRSILCLAALLLSACGASGALYLPDHPRHKANPLNKEPQRKSDGAQSATPAAPAAASAPNPSAAPQPNPDPAAAPAPQP